MSLLVEEMHCVSGGSCLAAVCHHLGTESLFSILGFLFVMVIIQWKSGCEA